MFPKAILERTMLTASGLGKDCRDYLVSRGPLPTEADAGRRLNETLACRAIQLFGLFRVFGEQLEGQQKRPSAKTENDSPLRT